MLKIKNKISILIVPLIMPLLGYALFFRISDEDAGQVLTGATIALGIALIMFFMIALKLLYSGKIPVSRELRLVFWFFFAAFLFPLISFFAIQTSMVHSLQFSVEMAANGLLFFVCYFTVRLQYVSIKTISIFLAILGIYSGLFGFIVHISEMDSLRRLRGSAGLNLLGSVTAASAVACLYLAASESMTRIFRWVFIVATVLTVLLLIMIGSRQALLAFSLSALIFTLFIYDLKRTVVIGSVVLFGAIIAFSFIARDIDLFHLQQRFTTEKFFGSMQERLEIYATAFSEVGAAALLFGRPDLYELWSEYSTHPHNYFISSLRNLGIVPTVTLILALMATTVKIRVALRSSEHGVAVMVASLYLLLAFYYVMVSGNMTRSLNLPIFWGFALGVADMAFFSMKQGRDKA